MVVVIEEGVQGGGAPCNFFFKEFALRVNILDAQNRKLVLKYVKIMPP